MYFIEMIFSLRFQEQYLNFLRGKCRKGINKIDMEIIFSNFHFDENGRYQPSKLIKVESRHYFESVGVVAYFRKALSSAL